MADTPKQKFDKTSEEMVDFMFGLAQEGDRSAVVLGAARVDTALEDLLKSTMRPHPDGADNLFDSDRPLGTFSAKISLAYRLNLIDYDFEHALQILRKIRNEFAHSTQKLSLSQAREKDRLKELTRTIRKVGDRFQKLYEIISNEKTSPELTEFSTSVVILLVMLSVRTKQSVLFTLVKPATFSYASTASKTQV